MNTKNWPFSDPPNAAVIVNKKIVDGGDWIAYVTHDLDDGMWQFHTSDSEPPSEEDAMVASLGNVVRLDSSVSELADLPRGWHAWRVNRDAQWQRGVMQA
jgi:hypothetical protein